MTGDEMAKPSDDAFFLTVRISEEPAEGIILVAADGDVEPVLRSLCRSGFKNVQVQRPVYGPEEPAALVDHLKVTTDFRERCQ